MLLNVPLFKDRQGLQIVQGTNIAGVDSGGGELPPVEGALGKGMLESNFSLRNCNSRSSAGGRYCVPSNSRKYCSSRESPLRQRSKG